MPNMPKVFTKREVEMAFAVRLNELTFDQFAAALGVDRNAAGPLYDEIMQSVEDAAQVAVYRMGRDMKSGTRRESG